MSEKENIREIIVIGRGAESNFVANDGSVSRQHAQIIDYGTYYTVVDLGSTNGTFVNGRRVASETTLHSGDELKVGNVVVPWEQLVQPPQKQKKAKVLLAILIPVIAMLLIGGVVGAYFIWWHGKDVSKLANENRKKTVELSQQKTENEEKAKRLEEEQNAKKALEEQKNALDAEKKKAEKDREEANREAEKAKKDAEKARKDAENARKDADNARKEAENAKAEVNTKTIKIEKEEEAQKKQEEDKKKELELDKQEAQKNQELKNQYETIKTAINKLSDKKAKDVCYDLNMNLPLTANYKNELLKKAASAYNDKDKAKLDEIDKAIKRNL